VTAETPTSVLDSAWGHIPHSRETTAGTGSFTRARVERIISVAAGVASLLVGVQGFLIALGPSVEQSGWHLPLMVIVFVPLAVMVVACFIGRGVRVSAAVFACLYVVAVISWPVATAGVELDPHVQPWIWFVLNLATLAAVLAFPLPLQMAWTILLPLLFGLARLIAGDFAPEFWIPVGLDVSFALIFGAVLLTLAWVFRSVAANVDETRARAVSSYAAAAAADAAEDERVAVAALMHDSVLAALIAAERAESPRERTLAVAMAREALTRLANAEQDSPEGSDEPRDLDVIGDDIETAAREVGADLQVIRSVADDAPEVPGRVARALTLAAAQGVANALQHAGGAGLGVTLTGRDGELRIDVHDAGEGFDLDAVPDDRLGIRGSIIARVQAVGGTADLDTGPGGTTVRLSWREGSA
jgi:signal transduction histidine kinase